MIFNVVRSTFCNKMCTTLMSGLLQCLWYAHKIHKPSEKKKEKTEKFLLLLLSAVFQLVYIVCAALLLLLLDGCLLLYLFTSTLTAHATFFLSFVSHSFIQFFVLSFTHFSLSPFLRRLWIRLCFFLHFFLSFSSHFKIRIRICDKVGSFIWRALRDGEF